MKFKYLNHSDKTKRCIFDVDCPTQHKFEAATFKLTPLTTRIAINECGQVAHVIWTPCSKHYQEVLEAARDNMNELMAIWKKKRQAVFLKNATMDDRMFSPASGSTRLI